MDTPPAPPSPEGKPPSRVRNFLGWVIGTLAASVLLVGVLAFLAWRSAKEEAAAPVAALLGGLAQVTGNIQESDVEQVIQQVAAALPVVEEDAPVAPPDIPAPSGVAVAPAVTPPDAAVPTPRVRPDPTLPMAWYDDAGQAHITLPEGVPLRFREALGLD